MREDRDEFAEAPEAALRVRMRGSNQSGVRDHNERLVLTLIREHGPLAKAEIARISGLSAQTVSVIMRSLERDGLLQKGAPIRGRVGQPSVPMGLAAEGAFFLGLKVGRRSLDLVLCDFHGAVKGRVRRTHRMPTPDGVVRFAKEAVAELTRPLSEDAQGRIAGLGVAMPFRLWSWAKTLGVDPAELEDWRRRDIAAELSEAVDLPVTVQNDATAACGAELVFGGADRPRDFLYFFIGFFVGGGMVLDNALMAGARGNAAAVGPMPVADGSGGMRQLMDVASIHLLERAMRERGLATDPLWRNPQAWDAPADLVAAWIARAADALAQAVLSACCVIDFEHVLIDGWVPEAVRDEIVAQVNANLADFDWTGIDRPKARPGAIGSDARALGAASLPLSESFLVKRGG